MAYDPNRLDANTPGLDITGGAISNIARQPASTDTVTSPTPTPTPTGGTLDFSDPANSGLI